LTWLKKQGIDDALIQPYSGHESRKSLEVYSKLAITDAQQEYNEVINKFPNLITSTLRVVSASLVLPLLRR
jgi:integrase/recombinase XerD